MPIIRHAATLLCVGALAACSTEPSSDVLGPDLVGPAQLGVSGGPSRPRVTGHGNFINQFGDIVRRSFNAIQQDQRDGVVVGHFVQHNASGFFAWGDINCVDVLGPDEATLPKEAVLSGTIRDSSIPELIDRTGIFRVGDAGEGHDDPAAVDHMSNLFVAPAGSPLDCRSFRNPSFTPITGGNIQIQP